MKEVCLLKYSILGQVAIIYGRKHEHTHLNSMQIFFLSHGKCASLSKNCFNMNFFVVYYQ